MGDSIGSRLLDVHGLAMGLSVLGLLVALPAQAGGGWSKAVANYLYPPPIHRVSNHIPSTWSGPTVNDQPVNIPSASPWENDSSKGGLGITALPNELQVNILANLTIRDLLVCKHVCKHWQTLVTTVPTLSCAAYRSCYLAGSAPDLNHRINCGYTSIRQWLNSFSDQGSAAVIRLDRVLACGGPYLPEQLFFAIANVLDETTAFDCPKVCTIEHPNPGTRACFSPDQQHLVTSSEHTIKICRLVDGDWQAIGTIGLTARILMVYFSPNSKYLVAVLDNDNAKIWQLTNGQWQQQADLALVYVLCHPIFNADTTYLVTVSRNHTAHIHRLIDDHWQLQDTALDHSFVWGARFHPKQHNVLATYYQNTVTLWRLSAGRWQRDGTLVHPIQVANIRFSPDGNRLLIYTGGPDQPDSETKASIHLWLRVGREWRQEAVLPVAGLGYTAYFSPSGHYIVSPPGETYTEIWKRSGSQWEKIENLISEDCYRAFFSPDERNLATHSWLDSAIIWQDSQGLLVQEAVIPCIPWPHVSFSPHGNHLLAATDLKTVIIWGIVDGKWQAKATLPHDENLHAIRFSPQGSHVLTTTWEGTVNIWALNRQW